jgi:flagellar protein FlbT|tara:strand:- start:15 stop:500 length:486 start_codon:yes stop_codon:yes gene_type:complete
MALKLNLKPHEKCIIGGAAVQNGTKMASLMIANQTTILREKHIMTEEKADTLAKQIYFVVQLIYLDGGIDNSKQNHEIFFKLIREFIDLDPSGSVLEIIGKIGQYLLDGVDYKALAECRKLVEYENMILNRQLDASNRGDVNLQKDMSPKVSFDNQLEAGS